MLEFAIQQGCLDSSVEELSLGPVSRETALRRWMQQTEIDEGLASLESDMSMPNGAERQIEGTFIVAEGLRAAGDTEEARGAYMVCLSSGDPEWGPRSALGLGTLLRDTERAEAIKFFRRAMASGHSRWAPAAAGHLGNLLAEANDPAGAREAYEVAMRSNHDDIAPAAAMNLGILLAVRGDPTGAARAYRVALESGHPHEAPRAAVNLGHLLVDSDPHAARELFERAIASGDPEQVPLAQLNLGAVFLNANDEPAARSALERGVSSGHPVWAARCAEALHKLDEVHRVAGELSELGEEWCRRREYEQALPLFQRAIEFLRALAARNPEPFDFTLIAPLHNLGFCLLELHRTGEALPIVEESVALIERYAHTVPTLEPQLAQVLISLANAHGQLGQLQRAMAVTDRVLHLRRGQSASGDQETDANLAEALRVYAMMRGAAGEELEPACSAAGEAVSLYRSLVQRAPGRFEGELEKAHKTLAGVLERLGRTADAAQLRVSTGVRGVPWRPRD